MSRFPALFTARKRADNPPVATDAARLPPQGNLEDNVFSLLPPDKAPAAAQTTSQQTPKDADSAAEKPASDADPAPSTKSSSHLHQFASADLSRLAISDDGKLYWDGKPVEVRRRLSLSPEQVMAAAIVAVFLVIGAIGAAAQGSLALRDWGCRLGWTANYCALPDKAPHRLDIPA
jgi:hypothetical protein